MAKAKLDLKIEEFIDDIVEKFDEIKEVEKEFEQIKVTSDKATLRPFPKHDIKSVGKVGLGAEFNLLEEVVGSAVANSNIWYKILVNGKEVYIHSSYVIRI